MARVFGCAIGTAMTLGALSTHAADKPSPPKPMWPDNGIAQRKFPDGNVMFVENDRGKLRAWVLSQGDDGAEVEALDFFSGERMKADVLMDDGGYQLPAFTDPKGRFHSNMGNADFNFTGGRGGGLNLPGINFEDGVNVIIDGAGIDCTSLRGHPTFSSKNYLTEQDPPVRWSKFTIYHSMGSTACPKGFFYSSITSALDLNDGTFLAVEDCFVFRLRKSDLSPAGSAPALRIVDEGALHAAGDEIKQKRISDTSGYLASALNLPTSPELSCSP